MVYVGRAEKNDEDPAAHDNGAAGSGLANFSGGDVNGRGASYDGGTVHDGLLPL